jgi:hypothetical protein
MMWGSRSWWRYRRLLKKEVPNRVDPLKRTTMIQVRDTSGLEPIASSITDDAKAQTSSETSLTHH